MTTTIPLDGCCCLCARLNDPQTPGEISAVLCAVCDGTWNITKEPYGSLGLRFYGDCVDEFDTTLATVDFHVVISCNYDTGYWNLSITGVIGIFDVWGHSAGYFALTKEPFQLQVTDGEIDGSYSEEALLTTSWGPYSFPPTCTVEWTM